MSEKTEKFLEDFKAMGIEAQNWPRIFEVLTKAERNPLISSRQSIEVATVDVDIDLRAIFTILDKYISVRLTSDKVLEGILKDISNNADRIAGALEKKNNENFETKIREV